MDVDADVKTGSGANDGAVAANGAAPAAPKRQFVEELVDKEDDYSRWYNDLVLKAQLAEWGPVRGCMVIRPYGYALWENTRDALDRRIKATGHQNAYFPLLIPESYLAREAEHVEGFAPQVAWVTQGGNDPLEERLAIRPTSEAIIGMTYSKWVQSWRDLPLLINQWANVMRWEKRRSLFLRTIEFLWQEGHTVHATEQEAEDETLLMLDVYRDFVETELAIPVLKGRKSEAEKFAGALRTYSIEAMMGDGKALQAGTSHNLGQHFAKVFDVTFLDRDNQRKYAWQTSWGVSTRIIGAIIMVHGDDSGLILPPRVAPIQVVMVPIGRSAAERELVLEAGGRIEAALRAAGVRVHFDKREEQTPGWKFNEWEMRGVPLRLEIGPRDVKNEQVVLVRRDTREKRQVPISGAVPAVQDLLVELQGALFQRALDFRAAHTWETDSYAEFKEWIGLRGQEGTRKGFVWAGWCGSAACEAMIKDETGATIRNIPFDRSTEPAPCLACGQIGEGRVVFARAY